MLEGGVAGVCVCVWGAAGRGGVQMRDFVGEMRPV